MCVILLQSLIDLPMLPLLLQTVLCLPCHLQLLGVHHFISFLFLFYYHRHFARLWRLWFCKILEDSTPWMESNLKIIYFFWTWLFLLFFYLLFSSRRQFYVTCLYKHLLNKQEEGQKICYYAIHRWNIISFRSQ